MLHADAGGVWRSQTHRAMAAPKLSAAPRGNNSETSTITRIYNRERCLHEATIPDLRFAITCHGFASAPAELCNRGAGANIRGINPLRRSLSEAAFETVGYQEGNVLHPAGTD